MTPINVCHNMEKKVILSYLAQAPEGPILYNGDIILVEINMVQLPGNKILSFTYWFN